MRLLIGYRDDGRWQNGNLACLARTGDGRQYKKNFVRNNNGAETFFLAFSVTQRSATPFQICRHFENF